MEGIKHLHSKRSSIFSQNLENRNKRNSFYRNYLRDESKRFSRNVLGNTLTVQKKTFFKLFALHLQTKPEERYENDIQATAKILNEENIFPQFNNDMKILRLIARYSYLSVFEHGEKVFSQRSQNTDLYKVVEGSVLLQKDDNSKKALREKGEFIEGYSSFKYIKQTNAFAIDQTYLLKIASSQFGFIIDLYLKNKVIIKMLKTTPLLKNFTPRQINQIVEQSVTREYCHHEKIIEEGTDYSHLPNQQKIIYYLIQGEVNVFKKFSESKILISSLTDNSLIGEEILFFDRPYPYTVLVKSLNAKLLCISVRSFLDLLKKVGWTIDSFNQDLKYTQTLKKKHQYYSSYLTKSRKIKSSFFERVASRSLSTTKREKLEVFTNVVGNIQKKVENLEKITHKRMNFNNSKHDINFLQPLFRREDFPLLQNSLKRFANEEKLALEKLKVSKVRYVR